MSNKRFPRIGRALHWTNDEYARLRSVEDSAAFPRSSNRFLPEKVDRSAIREGLKMTPSERLDAMQREAETRVEQQPRRVQEEPPNEPASPMKFYGEEFQPPPSTVPMLSPIR